MARRFQGLSERHKRIMEFLGHFQQKSGYSPSIRQIGDAVGIKSTSLIDYYLNQLEDMKYIQRDNHISRSIRILKQINSTSFDIPHPSAATRKDNDILRIPILGRIVASAPIPMPTSDLSYFDPESSIEVAISLLPSQEKASEFFALEVSGDSMVDAMVNDGDVVIMKPTQEVKNGEMVAVWLDDENTTTLKYFYRENNRIRLQPANPTMEPIYLNSPENLRIMGSVVMVIRQIRQTPN